MEGDDNVDANDENVETLGVRNFLAARIQEINSLSHQISTTGIPSSKGLAFQHVPKHMRRRAVSHNPKRLPKRLQAIHRSQVEKSNGSGSGASKKPKKPSRRHRRRPSNLLEEYNRRQRQQRWMETHIWHAKRFHMQNRWGYRMPVEPTGKGYRAGYRAATKYCAMRDISYYSCLQIEGDFDLISSTMTTAFAPKEVHPLSLSSAMFSTGKREGTMHFYQSQAYPFGYVGKVRFYWSNSRRLDSQDKQLSSLFLWVHPAQKEQVVEQICLEFELISKSNLVFTTTTRAESDKKIESNDDEPMDDDDLDSSDDEMEISSSSLEVKKEIIIEEKLKRNGKDGDKLLPKQLQSRPKWVNYSSNVTLTDLEGVFNRFRLYGPLATRTLKEVFQVLSPTKLKESLESVPSSSSTTSSPSHNHHWWINYYAADTKSKILTKQCELWDKLEGFFQIPCNSILPLTLNDPRISVPKRVEPIVTRTRLMKKEAVVPVVDSSDDDDLGSMVDELQMAVSAGEEGCSCSPLLNEDIRMKAINERMSQEEFNKRQSMLLIPGSKLNLGVEENQVPILLIHRPHTRTRGFKDGGWDLILPAGWAMSFWVALIYRSVRVLGLRESETFESESGSSINSNEDGFLPPDSLSGQTGSQVESNAARLNYFKYPPAKRSSFIKLGCPFPFKIDWKLLLNFNQKENNDSTVVNIHNSFYVQRNPTILKKLRNCISSLIRKNITDDATPQQNIFEMPTINSQQSSSVLIEIRLTSVGKGSIGAGAVICIPHEMDIVQREKSVHLEEPLGDDGEAHQKREELRNGRDRMKSFMQKKRHKLRKQQKHQTNNGQPVVEVDLSPYSSDRLDIINQSIDSLWLPDSEQVMKNMTRTPIGFLNFGRETYSIAKCSGIGYCTFDGLQEWFNLAGKCDWNPQRLVLVRDCRNSLVYRYAKLNICV